MALQFRDVAAELLYQDRSIADELMEIADDLEEQAAEVSFKRYR
jgi:hypothetical protein